MGKNETTSRTPPHGTEDGVNEFPARLEENHSWEVRNIAEGDIHGIARLFRRFLRPQETRLGGINMDSHHVFHKDINNFPTNWENPEEVRLFEETLSRFYFTRGPFEVEATKKKGEMVKVERVTKVCVRDGKIAGVYSYITDDPYAPESDRDRATGKMTTKTGDTLKMAYGHVLLVDPEHRRELIGLYLVGQVADEIVGQGGRYDQLTSCIDEAGDWHEILRFTKTLGFQEDFRRSSAYRYVNSEGTDVEGRRVILTREAWRERRMAVYSRIKQRWNVSEQVT